MLGLHQDIQQRARAELDELVEHQTSGDWYITSEQLRQMKYLDRVIKESLRMWPSIPFVARQMTEDVQVGGKY